MLTIKKEWYPIVACDSSDSLEILMTIPGKPSMITATSKLNVKFDCRCDKVLINSI